MNTKVMWIIIILLIVAVIVTAITGHQKPVVDPQPTTVIDVTPSPEPAPPPSPSPEVTPEPSPDINIQPDPTPSVIIVEITEEEKNAAFEQKAQTFVANLTAEDADGQIEVKVEPINRTIMITYNLSDEDVRDFAVALANDPLLTYNDMIADMIDQATVKEMKTEMYCEHLIICLRNNGQIFAAYDVIKGEECPSLIENVG